LYSAHAVEAWLRTRPERVEVIEFLPVSGARGNYLRDLAAEKGVHCRFLDAKEAVKDEQLASVGWRAIVRPYPYASLSAFTRLEGPQLVVVLDHVMDPRNVGAVIRSTLAAGGAGVVIPRDRAARITAAVESAAAGACAYLPVAQVVNLSRALEELKRAGYWVAALDARAEQSLFGTQLPPRIAVVTGGEEGLSRLVRETADFLVHIPMDPRVESLNTAVAVSLACFWWRKVQAET
jgi:23S rRNA (guanosine2251-2'-O)-methyltransferase